MTSGFLNHVACTVLVASALWSARAGAPSLGGSCRRLNDIYSHTEQGVGRPSRALLVYGVERNVSVYWDASSRAGRAAGAGRAASALLVAVVRYGLRFTAARVSLRPEPRGICGRARNMQKDCNLIDVSDTVYNEIVLAPAMAWTGKRCLALEQCNSLRILEPRLLVEGRGAAPFALRLHARLHPTARARPHCRTAAHWSFYGNRTDLIHCRFIQHLEKPNVKLISVQEWNNTALELASHINITFDLVSLGSYANLRQFLLKSQRTLDTSILFLDLDLYEGEPGVLAVTTPAELDLGDVGSLRVADVFVLTHAAPQLLQSFRKFAPKPSQLLEILDIEAGTTEDPEILDESDIMEAACTWALNNKVTFESWLCDETRQQYWILVFLCENDADNEDYKRTIQVLEKMYSTEQEYDIRFHFKEVDCADESDMNNEFSKVINSKEWSRLIGVLASGQGTQQVARLGTMMETPLVVVDVPARAQAPRAPRTPAPPPPPVEYSAARFVAGTADQLAIAIRHFLYINKWSRIGVISEDTRLAADLFGAISLDIHLKLRNIRLTKQNDMLKVLQSLDESDTRIFFVNTNPYVAEIILCAALELNMVPGEGYAWIAREWRSVNFTCRDDTIALEKMEHFTISYWWRGEISLQESSETKRTIEIENNGVRESLERLWSGRAWPPLAAPLSDAAILLTESFKAYAKSYTRRMSELHGDGSARLLLESIDNTPIQGVIQKLYYAQGSHLSPKIFISRWHESRPVLLQQWQIKNNDVINVTRYNEIYIDAPPNDGTSVCFTSFSGDFFAPFCHDIIWLVTGVFFFGAFVIIFISWKKRRDRLYQQDSILKAQLLAQRTFVSKELVDHQVDRAALELYCSLGEGCFGRVRFGIMRAPDRLPLSVAVKEIREDIAPVEERELLREAIILASLQHEHIVRLIGVCTTGGPLLMLMEYAFFGDLQKYLCKHRHLVDNFRESIDDTDEASQVSAKALTRLGMEAASALEYLSSQRTVHRDIRASNCLIDGHRSLKLADFGLARKTTNGNYGEIEEYESQRRGLFPVLWMAPESLERGVFTAASDAWALGVLLLEVATLGARPYGDWPPLRVLRHVTAGGRPPLPADMAPDTQRLVELCWRTAPEERLSAADVVRELRANPTLLQATLLPPQMPTNEYCPSRTDVGSTRYTGTRKLIK